MSASGGQVLSARATDRHDWRAAGVDGVDDLGVVDVVEVDRGGAVVGVSELALDDDDGILPTHPRAVRCGASSDAGATPLLMKGEGRNAGGRPLAC